MKNLIHTQAENASIPSHVFVDEKLLSENQKHQVNIKKFIYPRNSDLKLKRTKSPFTDISKRIIKGYLIKGVLNERDDKGRFMTFTCYYSGSEKDIQRYFHACFSQINKSVNQDHLEIVKTTISNFRLIRNLLLGISATFIFYSLFK